MNIRGSRSGIFMREKRVQETLQEHKRVGSRRKTRKLYSIKSKLLLEIDCFIIEHLGYQLDKEILGNLFSSQYQI